MKRFVEGLDRGQSTLFLTSLDDYVTEDNPVRAVDVFVDGLDLERLGFIGVQPLDTGRPGYHPALCSSSTSMAISIGFRRADAWSGNASATSR
jgi:transposase